MITINKVDSIPENAIKSKNGELTKKIYICGDKIIPDGFNKISYTFAKNNIEEILFENSFDIRDYISTYAIIKNNLNIIKKETISNIDGYNLTVYGNFIIETDNPVEILRENSFYYVPYNPIELKPMPKIDKLIDSSTFENVSTKLQEINNLLKVSSDNLKTIMDANSLLYEPTDNFSSLVQKLNDEPINFLLEGTKIRSIFGKYLSIYPSAPPAGVEYYHLEFTNIKNDSWIDLKEDLSLKQDGSISLYKESINDGRNDQTTYYIYSENKIYANIDSSYMFNLGLSMIYSINFKNLYVDYVENASHLFENISGNNGDCPLCHMINFLNLRFKNIKNINYMFNHYNLADENHFRIESNNIIDYSNFCENHDWNNGYNYLILDYINDKTKKIAETIVSESNNNVKLGTLVTQ